MEKFLSHIKNNYKLYLISILIVLNVILFSVFWYENRRGILKFELLDIGQGDSIYIESPTGVKVLIDGGPNNALMSEISKILPWYDRRVDMLVVTNPDKDHYEGFISFLKKYKTDVVLESGTNSKTETYAILEKEIEDLKIPRFLGRRGQVIDIGGGAYIEILFPDRDVSGLSSNDGSLVMRLVYGKTSMLLQGDSTSKIENYLLSLGDELKSDIIKVGHHGSKTSSSFAYIKSVSPEYAVISSGINNKYGHPNQETLDVFDKLKIKTLDTCSNGRIIFYIDKEGFTLKNKNLKPTTVGCKL